VTRPGHHRRVVLALVVLALALAVASLGPTGTATAGPATPAGTDTPTATDPSDGSSSATTIALDTSATTLFPVDPGVTEATETYRTAGGQELSVLITRPPDADGTRPAIVMIHGGGWYSGEPADMQTWADLAANAGWVAFSLEYRLAAQGGGSPAWPEAFQDVQAGVEWVHANAGRYGADPGRLAVFGESAGAHLTVLLAIEGTGGEAEIRAATAWSAPLDLAPLSPSNGSVPGCAGNPPCEEFWSIGVVDWFLGCPPSSCSSAYAEASPMGQVTEGTAPLWYANSTEELVPLPPANQLDQELTAAGVDHRLVVVPGMAHAHGYGEAVWNDMVPWLADRLDVERPDPAPFPGSSGDRTRTLAVAVGTGMAVLLLALAVAAVHERHKADGAADGGSGHDR
jgi:acetyl esterase/lipase